MLWSRWILYWICKSYVPGKPPNPLPLNVPMGTWTRMHWNIFTVLGVRVLKFVSTVHILHNVHIIQECGVIRNIEVIHNDYRISAIHTALDVLAIFIVKELQTFRTINIVHAICEVCANHFFHLIQAVWSILTLRASRAISHSPAVCIHLFRAICCFRALLRVRCVGSVHCDRHVSSNDRLHWVPLFHHVCSVRSIRPVHPVHPVRPSAMSTSSQSSAQSAPSTAFVPATTSAASTPNVPSPPLLPSPFSSTSPALSGIFALCTRFVRSALAALSYPPKFPATFVMLASSSSFTSFKLSVYSSHLVPASRDGFPGRIPPNFCSYPL